MFAHGNGSRSVIALGLLLLALLGCTREGEQQADVTREGPTPVLDEAGARRALLAMIARKDESEQEFLGQAILKAGKGLVLSTKTDGALEGHWTCDPDRKTFVFVRPIGATGLYTCHGVFEEVEGDWRARITGEARATPHP
jgi:hypothetical protein